MIRTAEVSEAALARVQKQDEFEQQIDPRAETQEPALAWRESGLALFN